MTHDINDQKIENIGRKRAKYQSLQQCESFLTIQRFQLQRNVYGKYLNI